MCECKCFVFFGKISLQGLEYINSTVYIWLNVIAVFRQYQEIMASPQLLILNINELYVVCIVETDSVLASHESLKICLYSYEMQTH